MNEKELNNNIEKIKQLLTLPNYDKIDDGIELAVSLEEPKIFEMLFDGCYKGESGWKYEYQPYSSLSFSGKLLNNWMKSTIVSGGELNDNPTGYYIYLSLLVNSPLVDLNNIKEINLTNGYLRRLPKNFSKLKFLKKLNLQLNKLEKFPDEIIELKNLTHLHLGWNNLKTIPDDISELEKLQSLMLGNNSIEKNSENLGSLKNIQHLDIGSNNLAEFPPCIFKLKSLLNINFINYDDEGFYFDEEGISKSILKNNPNVYIIQPVHCISCGDDDDSSIYRAEDTIERHDGYFCESHDEQWDNPYYYCDCCSTYVAPRGYINDDSLRSGYDRVRWFIDATVDEASTIIKGKDGSFSAKVICELCKPNIPETDKPSYEEAEKFAEENSIESWE